MSKLEETMQKASRIRTYQEYSSVRKVKPVDQIVLEKARFDSNIITLSESESPISEEYRKLKSMVIRETKTDFLNTLMVTSAIASEGKTITAINLAVALAQEIDHSILLVDADLRQPMIAKYLGIEYKYGLTDYLTRDIEVSEVILKTGIGNLMLIPGGHIVRNPVELLSSTRMNLLMKELKHRYMDRYVIIDTPPVLPFADTITIGSGVDGVIFVIQEGRAQISSIQEALNLMKDLKILGTVYNNVSSHVDGHYSHYYKHNYRYRKEK